MTSWRKDNFETSPCDARLRLGGFVSRRPEARLDGHMTKAIVRNRSGPPR